MPATSADNQYKERGIRCNQGRGHQQRLWTSAGQSELGRQHAQHHRRPEEQDRPAFHQVNHLPYRRSSGSQPLAEDLVVRDVGRPTVRDSHSLVKVTGERTQSHGIVTCTGSEPLLFVFAFARDRFDQITHHFVQ